MQESGLVNHETSQAKPSTPMCQNTSYACASSEQAVDTLA